ncbi:hypothetical protein Clacol_001931 [Clathrus columnatus]|uniref:Uncharacterized protein n=1 Tax=Clathrus columnatus TaxID=1419009 RepID=A0AAV4ZZE2_9AGAM|nr:hypothetical protein Clacol_001931 [Clathrus columnatus]
MVFTALNGAHIGQGLPFIITIDGHRWFDMTVMHRPNHQIITKGKQMRSAAFLSALFFLFPVLISGVPFVQRIGGGTGAIHGSSTSTPINGEPVNSTSSTAPTGSSNTTDSSSNSTSSVAPDLATSMSKSIHNKRTLTMLLDLMTLTLLIAEAFYEQSAAISQGLGDFSTSAILGAGALINAAQLYSLNPAASDLNCTIDLGSVTDKSNTANLINSIIYIEMIKLMGSANLLSNTSLDLSQSEQDILNDIYENADQFSGLAANVTMHSLPLGNNPNLTQEDYSSLLFRFNPSCLGDLGLENLPSHPQQGLGAPHSLQPNFVVGTGNIGCSDVSVVFCQVITGALNATAVVSPEPGSCSLHASAGVALFYTTRTSEPLPVDLTERQAQDGNMCSGPEILLLH